MLGLDDSEDAMPDRIAFMHNYPNPFNASTTIEFTLLVETEVELAIYNILGQKITSLLVGRKPAGDYSITWDAGDSPSGVYFARLETEGYFRNIKIVLLK
jgi:hypothetical protein